MVMTSSGVKVSVSVGEPATFDLAGYSSKSYLEIGELTTIPSFGANAALVTHSPLATGVVKKHKGFVDYGETTIEAAMDNEDLGQQIIIALNEGNIKDSDCTIKLDYPDEASRYFTGKIFAFNEAVGSANNIIGISFDVKLNSPLIRFGGGDGTPASLVLSFETQNYLQEGQVLSFSDIITFSRSTTSTYFGREVDQFGNVTFPLKTAAIDEPCLAYDPATGESLGLQVFGSDTNLLAYSEEFDNTGWSLDGATLNPNSSIAPDTSNSMYELVDTVANSAHRVRRFFTSTLGIDYTFSCFAKAGSNDFLILNSGASGKAYFNLSTGEVATVVNGGAKIESVGNGIYRCSVTATSTAASAVAWIQTAKNDGVEIYEGDGSSIYIWGAQLETGSIATPYIKTEASQVTRAADLVSVNDLSGWYNQAQGSIFADFNSTDSGYNAIATLDDSTLNNRIAIAKNANGIRLEITASSVTQVNKTDFAPVDSGGKVSASIGLSGFTSFGGSAEAYIVGALPIVSKMVIGNRSGGDVALSGHIKTLSYYPAALSAQKLQDLTR